MLIASGNNILIALDHTEVISYKSDILQFPSIPPEEI